MNISFTTLGCPAWDLDMICARGREYGFDGVDFRGYQGEIDVTRLKLFTNGAAATLRQLAGAGLRVSGISSGITVCVSEKAEANLEEARRTIAVCQALEAPYVRLFGGGDPQTHSRAELAKIGAEMVEQILALDGARELKWCFETHDQWIQSRDCRLLLDAIPDPAFGALWDMGHTPRVGGEMPEATLDALNGRVYYTHVKDAEYNPEHPQAMADGWHYVLPGTGILPIFRAVKALQNSGYQGWIVFEHEKRWHPELPEPELAFPAFAQWARAVTD
jgi:sugar phosphate isomerase/epimerase